MPSEWRDNLVRGSGAVGRRLSGVVSAVVAPLFKAGGFIFRGFNNIALLDPEFGKPQEVVIGRAASQFIFKNQRCEFLPESCFQKRPNMKIRNGFLIVQGRMLPVFEMKDEKGKPLVDAFGNKLFAINTNQSKEALGIFGLNRKTHLNKVLVVASLGGEAVPVGGRDRRMMREYRNLKLNVDTRRVVDRETGETVWTLTLLMLPIHLVASAVNLAMGVVYGLFYRTAALLDRCSKYFEEEADRRIISEANGTLIGGGSSVPYAVCALLCRIPERVLSFCACLSGSARKLVVQPLRSVTIFVNAMYNQDELQYQAGKEVLLQSAGDTWQNVKGFCASTARISECSFARMSKNAATLLQRRSETRAGDVGSERGAVDPEEGPSGRRGAVEGHSRVRHGAGARSFLLSGSEEEQVRSMGASLMDSGVRVSYGTSDQLCRLSEVLSTGRAGDVDTGRGGVSL